jgi:hypothetical protein
MPTDSSGRRHWRSCAPAGAFTHFQSQRRIALEKARASRGIAAGWHGKTPARILRLALVYELLAWVRPAASACRVD